MATTVRELRERIAFLERNYERSGLATADEIAAVATRFKGRRDKDALWDHLAHLKALGLSRASRLKQRGRPVTESQLETAAAALAEKPEEVELPSLGLKVKVCPASYARIERIEEHAFWMNMLEGARSLFLAAARANRPTPASASRPCPECGTPRQPGNLDAMLKQIDAEISAQRAAIYAQVTAPTPAPVDGTDSVVDWVDKITPVEDVLLMQAYHRVNYDVISGLPQPRSGDGERELPLSWAFLFASMAVREKRPAVHIVRDRSLPSIVATFVLEEIRQQAEEQKRKKREAR